MRRAFSSLVASSSSRRLCSRRLGDDDDRRARCFFCRIISRRFWSSSSTSLSSNDDCTNDDDDFDGATLKTIGNRWFLGHSSRHGRGAFALRDVVKNERIFFDDDDDGKTTTTTTTTTMEKRRRRRRRRFKNPSRATRLCGTTSGRAISAAERRQKKNVLPKKDFVASNANEQPRKPFTTRRKA